MKTFLRLFIKNNGIWVFLARMVSKGLFFLMNIILVHLLSKYDYGLIMLALNFLGFFLSMVGMGNYQAVLRYGAQEPPQSRNKLFNYLFTYGLYRHFAVNALMLVLAYLFYRKNIEVLWLVLLLSLRFLGIYFIEFSKAKSRALLDNKTFATYDIIFAVLSLLLGTGLAYFWGLYGFVLSLCLTPFFILFMDHYQLDWQRITKTQNEIKALWRFSWVSALGSQISGWIFMIDLLMIGWLLGPTEVASYRVASIIPFNLLFIGQVFLQTDYAKLCQAASGDKKYIQKYLFNYWKIMLIICIPLLVLGWWQEDFILSIFGKDYTVGTEFRILLLSTILSLLLRLPLNYILAALGASHWNLKIALIVNLSAFVGLYYLLPGSGILGVAYFTLFNIALSCLLSAFAYRLEIKKL